MVSEDPADTYLKPIGKGVFLAVTLALGGYVFLDTDREHLRNDINWCADYAGKLVTRPDGKRECLNHTHGQTNVIHWKSGGASGVNVILVVPQNPQR